MNRRPFTGLAAACLALILALSACTAVPGESTDTPAPTDDAVSTADSASASDPASAAGSLPATEPESTTEEAVPMTYLTLDATYTLVCPAETTETEAALCRVLAERLTAAIPGLTVADSASAPAEHEILIGATGRPESDIAIPAEADYTVCVTGAKLVLRAVDGLSLDAALLHLTDTLAREGNRYPSGAPYHGKLEEKLLMVADQGHGEVRVYDIAHGTVKKPVWSVKTEHSGIAGIKVRNTDKFGTVVLSCAGDAQAFIYSYPNGRKLMSFSAAQNAHSVEISPDGEILAVASSTGGEVRFHRTERSARDYVSIALPDAHGVLYDEAGDCFWLIGKDVLAAYRATLSGKTLSVEPIEGKTYTIPTTNAHDLQPVAKDPDCLWISTSKAVYRFDKTTGEFHTDYPHADTVNQKKVKGISSFRDGSFCLVVPDEQYKSWTSNTCTVSYRYPFLGTEEIVTLPLGDGTHIYKLRAFVPEYAY